MSTVMEVIAAKQAGFQIIGLSAITNKADGGPDQKPIQSRCAFERDYCRSENN